MHSIDAELLKKNVGNLATFASKMKMPLVLTSSMETNMQGLLLEVIQKEAPEPYAKRTKRQGIVNAWQDEDFASAVRATGKTLLIVAGVTTDVCLVPTTSVVNASRRLSHKGELLLLKETSSDIS
ncbi:hypothetical protein ABVK25_001998 [Lepraria finkii]|uniref:Isochorismatase-like domain-containing protein n=1 Tax=Lepraria finkii TaxID=1340010 RepID=A0ABR4BIF6_9LECA